MRVLLLIFVGFLAGCATPVDIPQSKGKRLPTAGEHLPPPDFSANETSDDNKSADSNKPESLGK